MDKSKQYFFDVLALLVIVLIINLIFFVMPFLGTWKNALAPARTITVSAQGSTTVTPDEAEISFSVLTQGANPQQLSDNNNTKMNAVIAFAKSEGVASSDIATTAYDLQPNYHYDKNGGSPTIVGYTLTQTVQVKVRDLTKVAGVLSGLAPLGVNQIGGVNFTFQDPNKFVGIARADALTKAQKEASEMAAQAGASLGQVVTLNESPNVPVPYMAYGMSANAGGAMAAPVAPTIQPGTQNVTDSVTVTYQLN